VHFRDEVAAALARAPRTRVLVLDTIGMSDVDFTGSRELGRVLQACERQHVVFGVARAGDHVREILRRGGLEQRIGENHFYATVDAAVTALTAEPPAPS
jgi:MFS superfamily sulfate permease-like transporter